MYLMRIWFVFLAITVLLSCQNSENKISQNLVKGSVDHIQTVTMAIDDAALSNADDNQGDWLSYGRNYSEDRYSALDQINKDNLNELGLAWSLELPSTRGVQSTPIVVDGIMYFTAPWSVLYAVDTRKGTIIWSYDPEVPRSKASDLCCGVVNRGVALYKGALFLGTLDGRLQSVDAATGKVNWSVMTIPENSNYSVTGAPRIANGKVIIGNGGAELNGVRGYVTAYDAQTGNQAWRFYTVPGNPKDPVENSGLNEAMKTWTGEWWRFGGGGTVWDSIVFEPELNLVYIGVGNGSPWNREIRSPKGGDNLYLSSIVALDADSGEYKWHYQTTPGDTWDYTATQPIVLADLEIDGAMRKVLMQAPKNGYFYVIDRVSGELISADNFAYQNWTTGIDENGRPIETDGARFTDGKTHWIAPSAHGAHNWNPMSYNHETGLVYIPASIASGPYSSNKGFPTFIEEGVLEGYEISASIALKSFEEQVIDPKAPPPGISTGELIAYDPINQERVWVKPQASHYNGGMLSTTTGLLIHGDAEGVFYIRDTETGRILKEFDVRAGVIAPPITYMVDGEQYITIIAEWGGSQGQHHRMTDALYNGQVYTFKLGGTDDMPKSEPSTRRELTERRTKATDQEIGWGYIQYLTNCVGCHGLVGGNGGALPNVARLEDGVYDNFDAIIRQGSLAEIGMPIHEHLSENDVKLIREYIYFVAQSLRDGRTPMDVNIKAAMAQAAAFEMGEPSVLSFDGSANPVVVPTASSDLDSVNAGKKAFSTCKSCHSSQEGERHKVGPNLWGIAGAEIAAADGYKYSKALQSLDGTWTSEALDAYLLNPKAFAPGTKMLIGEKREQRRADIIAYLETLN